MRPDVSWRWAKLALPMTRRLMRRPPRLTRRPGPSSSSAGIAVTLVQIGGQGITAEIVGEGIALGPELVELLAALGDQLVLVGLLGLGLGGGLGLVHGSFPLRWAGLGRL